MTNSTPAAQLEILVLANDSDDRHALAGQALGVLTDFDPTAVAIFAPVRLRIRQHGADIFDQAGPLASVFYGLTEWGYSVSLADWGRTELPQP